MSSRLPQIGNKDKSSKLETNNSPDTSKIGDKEVSIDHNHTPSKKSIGPADVQSQTYDADKMKDLKLLVKNQKRKYR